MMINKRLIGLCKESKKYIFLTIFVNWLAAVCNIVTIILIGQLINKVFSVGKNITKDSSTFIETLNKISFFNTGILIVVMLLIRFICNILYVKFSNAASKEARLTLRELIYKKLLKLGSNYNKVESTASIVQVTVEGVEQLEVYFGKYIPQFFYSLLVPVTLFIFMSVISLKAAIVFIACVPLIPMSIIAIMKIAKRILKDYWKSYSNLGGTFLENLQGLTTLKVYNVDEERHVKMNKEAESFRKITMKVLSMQLNSITIMDVVAFGGAAFGSIVALLEFKAGQIEVGSLISIILLSSEFFIPLRLLGSYFHIAMNGMAASDRIFNLLDSKERTLNNDSNEEIKLKEVSISLNNVYFSYDKERQVIKNINMDISKGGIVAIVGESGSGKSTVASLILNNNEIDSGEILINNQNINNISINNLYNNVGMVSTSSYIFTGTILDNLLIAKKDATVDEINSALQKARLYDFVSNSKDGLNTNVGEGGNALSGGQKQRLALARVILSDKPMIIFDEATSNIDVESEEAILEAIYELAIEKTILVISHRLLNVVNAKNIYVLDKGSLIEEGTHSELYEKQGHYYKMFTNQSELEKVREV